MNKTKVFKYEELDVQAKQFAKQEYIKQNKTVEDFEEFIIFDMDYTFQLNGLNGNYYQKDNEIVFFGTVDIANILRLDAFIEHFGLIKMQMMEEIFMEKKTDKFVVVKEYTESTLYPHSKVRFLDQSIFEINNFENAELINEFVIFIEDKLIPSLKEYYKEEASEFFSISDEEMVNGVFLEDGTYLGELSEELDLSEEEEISI